GLRGAKPVTFTRTVERAKSPHRWVGALWAQSRVQHLLEEVALGGKAPELLDEVVSLALAYNFVTPYTSFLAVPESELGDMKGTLEAAREQKRRVLAAHDDAVAARRGLGGESRHSVELDSAADDDKPKKRRAKVADAADDDESPADTSELITLSGAPREATVPPAPPEYGAVQGKPK